ncbi:hypothetical protein [Flavobacterium sp. LB1P62]|uniref:hypothetical protein n=1 Tax=Flavobacterium sp. LB1P62 TaxID=3401715 RepID=UPI003AAA53A8
MKYIKIIFLLALLPKLMSAKSIIDAKVYIEAGTDVYFEDNSLTIGANGILNSNGKYN